MSSPRPPYRIWKSPAPFAFRLGGEIPEYEIAWERWGPETGSLPPVVILHALSGNSHALRGPGEATPGWWEALFRDDAPLSPAERAFVCTNLLGGCSGSTGPSSIDPRTGKPYAVRFPQLTIEDMIEAHRALLRAIGIEPPYVLIGGSMGGMLALEWAVRHPEEVSHSIGIVSPGRGYAQAIALRSVQREAILADPAWNGGDYYGGPPPATGVALARQIGMITYRSGVEFDARFGRAERDTRPHFLDGYFEVQSYLRHQGGKFVDRFDANSYLYYSRAMDLYDLGADYGGLEPALGRVDAKVLLIGVSSDFLVPVEHMREVHDVLLKRGRDSQLAVLESPHGHDAFLIEIEDINRAIAARLA